MLTREPPLRVAVLCSRRAPGLGHLLVHPRRGSLFEIVGCLTTEDSCDELAAAEAAGVPCLSHPIRRFCGRAGARLGDLGVRATYDETTRRLLEPLRPDLLVLASYLLILTRPVLAVWAGRIVNVHHSDLTERDGGGAPRYAGLRSVRDAILAGEVLTRATAHLVTEAVDAGPPLLRSWAFPVAPLAREAVATGARQMLSAYVFAHQEWMLRGAWGPLLSGAVELFAAHRVRFRGHAAWIDGEPAPWDVASDGSLQPRGLVLAGAREG